MSDLTGDGFSEAATQQHRPAPIGDNSGDRLLTGETLIADINERHDKLFKEADAMIASEARIPTDADGNLVCPDDDWEQKLTDGVKKCASLEKLLDSHRSAEIQPYETNKNLVHGRFRTLMDKLVDPRPRGTNALKHRIERALTDYKAKKEEIARKAREEEARIRREAEEKAAREAQARREAAEKAEREAREAEQAAARKRNAEARAAAEETARLARERADAEAETAKQAETTAATAGNERAKAEKAANVKAADLTRVRGQASVGSLREFVDYRDFKRDAMAAELESVLEDAGCLSSSIAIAAILPHIPNAAIVEAWRSYMKVNKDRIETDVKNGKQPFRNIVTFFMNKSTTVR